MQLFYSTGSPFARAVRVALRETGLIGRVAEVVTTLRDPASTLLPHNPVGRVPTLVLPDGTALTETALILPFLDTLGGTYPLVPRAALADFGRVLGAMDGMAVWNRELRRPPSERSPDRHRAGDHPHQPRRRCAGGGGGRRRLGARRPARCAADHAGLPARLCRDAPPRLGLAGGAAGAVAWFDRLAARPSFAATIPPVSGI